MVVAPAQRGHSGAVNKTATGAAPRRRSLLVATLLLAALPAACSSDDGSTSRAAKGRQPSRSATPASPGTTTSTPVTRPIRDCSTAIWASPSGFTAHYQDLAIGPVSFNNLLDPTWQQPIKFETKLADGTRAAFGK